MTWQSRPVFISSTFSDMQAERDHLRIHVFPALEERLKARRCHLEWVDLRLGIAVAGQTDAEARELQVLKVCLSEVKRCRPFLIVLLGDRYGWVPPAERMLAASAEEGFAVDVAGHSVTDLEIRLGVLADPDQHPRSFFYFREPLPYRDMPADVASLYADVHDAGPGAVDRARRLSELKQEIERSLPERVRRYSAAWDRGMHRVTGLEAWGQTVLEDLWSDLEAVTSPGDTEAPVSWQEAERIALNDYVEDRARDFVGRGSILARLEALASSTPDEDAVWGVVITGVAGTGKSAVFGELSRRLWRSGVFVLRHAAGASARSPSVVDMLRRWTEELAAALNTDTGLPANADPDSIETAFQSLFSRTAAGQRIVVLVDALDQFEPTTRARFVTWLPRAWPKNARLIATAIPGDASKALAERRGVELQPLPPLDEDEARRIAEGVCGRYHRSLEPEVLNALLAKRNANGAAWGNTLWLVLAVEELNLVDADDFARAARTYTGAAAERIRALMVDKTAALAPDIPGLYSASFDRAYALFGERFAHAFLSLLAISRAGWRESDLRALLPQVSGEPWDPLRFASLRRLFRGQLRLRGAHRQWNVAHDQMRAAMQRRLTPERAAEASIHAAIVNHLLSLTPDDPIRESEAMVHLLGSEDWARTAAYYAGQYLNSSQLEAATREFARAFDKVAHEGDAAKSEQIADTMLRALTTRHPDSQLTLSRVNAWLTYMQDALLRKLLTRGARLEAAFDQLEKPLKDFALRCRGRLGERWRRDGKLDEAWALLRPLDGSLRHQGFIRRGTNTLVGLLERLIMPATRMRERSEHAVVYELGYIEFLRGNLLAARKFLERSAELETSSGNIIAGWASRCVAKNCAFIAELSNADAAPNSDGSYPEAEAFKRTLLMAKPIFSAAANDDPVAFRWAANIPGSLFGVAFLQGDRQGGRAHFDDLVRSDWARRFDKTELMLPNRARHEMLEENWKAAVEQFQRYFQTNKIDPQNYGEALAHNALDYGHALIQNGDTQGARDVWRAALTLPGDAGNRPWQSLIQRRLAAEGE